MRKALPEDPKARKPKLPEFNQKENGPDREEGGGEPRGQDRRISMTEDRIDTNRIRAACKQKNRYVETQMLKARTKSDATSSRCFLAARQDDGP